MAIKWKKDLQTGFERIDDQHKLLINKLNQFHQACEAGRGRNVLVEMLVFINNYVQAHFALEETFMLSKGYPQLAEHRSAHDKLREEYKRLTGVLAEDRVEPAVAIRANVFLDDWWSDHICKMDKKMVKFIKKNKSGKGIERAT